LFFEKCYLNTLKYYICATIGGLAHLARVLAWQARGDRFESGILHKDPNKVWVFFICILMFYTYIIYSKTINKFYVGSCQDVQDRLRDHLNGKSKYTKQVKDWELKYFESYSSRSEAYQREMKIKKMKSRKYIESLIENKN
jgi:putative endonuclease